MTQSPVEPQFADIPAGLFNDYYAYQRQSGIPRYTPVDRKLPTYTNPVDTNTQGEYEETIRRLLARVNSGNWTEEPLEAVVPFKEEERIPKGELVFPSSSSPSRSRSRHNHRRSRSGSSSYY